MEIQQFKYQIENEVNRRVYKILHDKKVTREITTTLIIIGSLLIGFIAGKVQL